MYNLPRVRTSIKCARLVRVEDEKEPLWKRIALAVLAVGMGIILGGAIAFGGGHDSSVAIPYIFFLRV